ncbi:MAG: RraA family protein, partial [Cyclobacteriaceae bacterium]|nr:RraA family protein [Cyclobacteriaceae bacterium]
MKPPIRLFLLLLFLSAGFSTKAQQISKEELLFLTPQWKGERFADGRPKVPDNILRRMKAVSVEEAWATMKNAGYA